MSSINICENIRSVKDRITDACKRAGRQAKEVRLIAVSKTKPIEDILKAVDCGHTAFGENHMQELADKMKELTEHPIEWHMIGTLQSNKIRHIAQHVDWIHSVAKNSHFKEIEKRAANAGRNINTLIQVNISGEEQKSGCEPEEVPGILEYVKNLPHVQVKGLMGIATLTDDDDQIRKEFRLLANVLKKYEFMNNGNIQLKELSMGMSADMEIAIEEGATMVRVGSDIFGARNYN